MSSWRIREMEEKIRQLERKLLICSEKEKYDIRRKIDSFKSELRRLKKREEEEEDEKDELLSSIIGIGIGSSSWPGGGFHFGGGSSGGGGFGGGW